MSAVPEDMLDRIRATGPSDVVVGIPSYHNAATIGMVAQTAADGIIEYYNGRGILINSDGDYADRTAANFMSTDTRGLKKFTVSYQGIPGKGTAVRAILEAARAVKAKLVILLDADLRSVKPWWLERLGMPIVRSESSYVVPYYLRHKYDGTITNSICHPLTTVLYGVEVRQPIGGDFGIGPELLSLLLAKPDEVWNSDVARFGIDIWMTTTAITQAELPVLQGALGSKIHDPKDPGADLGPMFHQVVGTLFELMETYQEIWKNVDHYDWAPVYGEINAMEIYPLFIDLESLKTKAKRGVSDMLNEARYLISGEDYSDFVRVLSDGTLDLEKWANFIFEFALLYRRRNLRDSIMKLLVPLYYARVAAFVEETEHLTSIEAEEKVHQQLVTFMEKKLTFSRKW